MQIAWKQLLKYNASDITTMAFFPPLDMCKIKYVINFHLDAHLTIPLYPTTQALPLQYNT